MLDCGGSAALPLRRREMYLESSLTKCQPVSSSIHSTDAYYYESDSLWKGWKANQDFWPQSAHPSVKKKKKKGRKKTRGTSLVKKLLMQGARQRDGEKAWGVNGPASKGASVAGVNWVRGEGGELRRRGRGWAQTVSGRLGALAGPGRTDKV